MIISTILLVLCNIAIAAAGFLYIRAKVLKLYQSFFVSPDDKTPSGFSLVVEQIAELFITKALTTLKAQSMQAQGVASRNEKAIESAVLSDALSSVNPMLGMALENLPSLKKLIAKRPELIGMIASKLGGAKSNSGNLSGNNGDGMKFKL